MFATLEAVPAFYAERERDGLRVPFIISLRMCDSEGRARLVPAVEKSINRTVEITGRVGLLTDDITAPIGKAEIISKIERAMRIKGAILLLNCATDSIAEQVMNHISDGFNLKLIREGMLQ